MRSIYFNELTLDKIPQQNLMLLRELQKVVAKLKKSIGCIQPLVVSDNATWDALCCVFANAKGADRDYLSLFRRQYQPEDDLTEDAINRFIDAKYKIRLRSGEMLECSTMGLAHLNSSLTLGFDSSCFWEKLIYTIEEVSSDGEFTHEVICVTKENQIEHSIVKSIIDSLKEESEDKPASLVAPIEVSRLRFNGEIKVLGAVNVMALKQTAANMGFDIKRFDFIPYDRVKNYDWSKLKNSASVAAIMCGPVPHSGAGMGDSSSLYNTIRKEPGYPPVEPLQESTGKLCVTISSFRTGLRNLMEKKIVARNFQ